MFKKIGQRIRKSRLEQDIKQKDLARKIGISQGALTNFELGRRKISLEWLVKIARALNEPVGHFLRDIEPHRDEVALGPRERRLVRAYGGLALDPRLQRDVLMVIERMSRHVARRRRSQV